MTELEIFKKCITLGMTKAGAAGCTANILHESNGRPDNVENTCPMSDEAYTKAVDDGSYTNFAHDAYGYGLCQWTFYTRKEALLKYAREHGVSISNADMQFQFLARELRDSYAYVWTILTTTKDPYEAGYVMCEKFERPAGGVTSAQQRGQKAREIYDRCKNAGVAGVYYDSSSETVASADYTLSGTLTAGTSTITVSYGGKTDTFTVTVSYPTREMLFGTLRPNVALLKNNSTDTPSRAVYVVNPSSAASSRAIVAGPIPNRNFVITSKDTSKYQVLVAGITSDTKMTTPTPSSAIDGYWYQGDNNSIAWANSGSSNADFVWIGLKNKNGADLSASELANSGEAIFSYTMT